jgi:uncharacterized iron-regulated protein
MNRTPEHLAIKIVLGTLFLIWLLTAAKKSQAEEYAVPNSGSPYVNLNELGMDQVLHIPTGTQVTKDQMIAIASGSRVIYIGETHDNLEAHRAQLEVIERLAKRFPEKITVGMEMFRQSAQPDLDRWNNGDVTPDEFKALFHKNWGPGFKLYQPIFKFLKENSIPLLGLKSSRDTEALLRKEGPTLHPENFPEMDASDRLHKTFSMSLFGGHADHAEALKKPYQMLLLWEESMAHAVAEFLKNNADRKLIVLAGGFHVQYGFGIPKRAFRRFPHAYSIILPTVTELPAELKDREMQVEHVSIPLYAGDFAWRLEYKVLPKNKVRLGVQLKESESGVKVLFVGKNSNAEEAGIVKDDVLLALGGKNIRGVDDLVRRLQTFKVGDHVTIHLRRKMEEMDVDVLLRKVAP